MTDVRPSHRNTQQAWQPTGSLPAGWTQQQPAAAPQGSPGYGPPQPYGWSQPPAGMPPHGGYDGGHGGGHGNGYGGYRPEPAPSNGMAVAALVLGIVCLCISWVPFLNQGGILAGIVGIGLGIAGIVIGARRRHRTVMAVVGTVLCVVGIIASVAATNAFVTAIDQSFPSSTSSASGGAAGSAAPTKYTVKIEGTAKRASVNFSVDGSSGSVETTKVPWTKTLDVNAGQSFHTVTVSAMSDMGSSGSLTCSILDEAGTVLETNTAQSQGGEYGFASVNCFD